MPVEVVIKAVNALDLDALPLNKVDILQKMVPNEQEVRKSSKTALFIKIFGYLNANPDQPQVPRPFLKGTIVPTILFSH